MRRAHRLGMTLSEILVSLLIFMIVSTAMLGIMISATSLYEGTEYAKAATDEAMAVLGMLDRDLSRAIAPDDGGHFVASVVDQAGACAVGWTIRNDDPNDPERTRFVYWVLDGDVLRRSVLDSLNDPRLPLPREDVAMRNPFDKTAGEVVTAGCLHFGVWLVGTSHNIVSGSDGAISVSTHPEPHRHWTRVLVPGGTNAYTEPIAQMAYDTRLRHSDTERTPFAYPSAVRFSLVLTGNFRHAPVARLMEDLPDETTDPSAALASGPDRFHIAGAGAVASLPGSILRIDDELIGYHTYREGRIHINKPIGTGSDALDRAPGPLNQYAVNAPGNGRGVLRSELAKHAKGAEVRFGRVYTLVKSLNR